VALRLVPSLSNGTAGVQQTRDDLYQAIMPIRGFLSGQAFEPEVVRQMSLALETICAKFGMKLTEDPATRVVALKIIELAQRGVHDAPTLTEMALKELKHCLPYA
jgi:hypothetical protein